MTTPPPQAAAPPTPDEMLLPCPFCGGQWTISQEPSDNGYVAGLYYAFHRDDVEDRCVRFTGHFPTREQAVAAINRRPAALSTTAAQAEAPDGYVLVPKEPTPEMIRAANDAWQARMRRKLSGEQEWRAGESFAENYRVMLTAFQMENAK